jgi:hypothetical protein
MCVCKCPVFFSDLAADRRMVQNNVTIHKRAHRERERVTSVGKLFLVLLFSLSLSVITIILAVCLVEVFVICRQLNEIIFMMMYVCGGWVCSNRYVKNVSGLPSTLRISFVSCVFYKKCGNFLW